MSKQKSEVSGAVENIDKVQLNPIKIFSLKISTNPMKPRETVKSVIRERRKEVAKKGTNTSTLSIRRQVIIMS